MNIFSQLTKNFSKLQLRERALSVALVSIILALGANLVLLKPLQQETNRLRAIDKTYKEELATAISDLANLDNQISRGVDPLAKDRALRDELLGKIAKADSFFAHQDVTGTQAGAPIGSLVRSLLQETPGLALVSLKTMPSQVFYTPPPPPPPPKATEQAVEGIAKLVPLTLAAKPEPPAPKPVAFQKTLYKHGVEITVKGNYAQLLSYMEKLQKYPQRVFWSEARLTVSSYPVNVLRIVIYTCSKPGSG